MKLVSQILAVAAVATLVVPAIAQTSTMSKPMMKKPMGSAMAMHNHKMIKNNRMMIKNNHKMIKKTMMKSGMKPMGKSTM